MNIAEIQKKLEFNHITTKDFIILLENSIDKYKQKNSLNLTNLCFDELLNIFNFLSRPDYYGLFTVTKQIYKSFSNNWNRVFKIPSNYIDYDISFDNHGPKAMTFEQMENLREFRNMLPNKKFCHIGIGIQDLELGRYNFESKVMFVYSGVTTSLYISNEMKSHILPNLLVCTTGDMNMISIYENFGLKVLLLNKRSAGENYQDYDLILCSRSCVQYLNVNENFNWIMIENIQTTTNFRYPPNKGIIAHANYNKIICFITPPTNPFEYYKKFRTRRRAFVEELMDIYTFPRVSTIKTVKWCGYTWEVKPIFMKCLLILKQKELTNKYIRLKHKYDENLYYGNRPVINKDVKIDTDSI